MKVLLLHDVAKVGKKHEVRDVPDGYARNFLLPKKLATFASSAAVASSEALRARRAAEKSMDAETLKKNFAELQDKVIEIQERANEQGHLFASIGEDEIAHAIYEQTKIKIEPSMIVLDKPIKEIGEQDIAINADDEHGVFRLVIVQE